MFALHFRTRSFCLGLPGVLTHAMQRGAQDILSGQSKAACEELEENYNLLLDVVEFKDEAFRLFVEIARLSNAQDGSNVNAQDGSNVTALDFNSSFELSAAFMDLVSLYFRLMVILGRMGSDRVGVSLGLFLIGYDA